MLCASHQIKLFTGLQAPQEDTLWHETVSLTWVLNGWGKNNHNSKRKFQEHLCSEPPCCLEVGFTCYFHSYLKPQVDSLLAIKPSVKTNLKQIHLS